VDATGRASALAVNPFDLFDVYLGGANGGVWHTTNGGLTWEPISDKERSLAIGALALDECSADGCIKIYAGTGENNIRRDTYYGAGLLVMDRMAGDPPFWVLLGDLLFSPGSINNVVLDPTTQGDSKRLYVTLSSGVTASASESTVTAPVPPSGFGIYRSEDDGVTWAKLVLPVPAWAKPTDLEMLPEDPDTLFAGFMEFGVYMSTDRGETWCALNPEVAAPPTCAGVSGLPVQETFDHVEISIHQPPSAADATLYAIFGNCPDPIATQNEEECSHSSGAGNPAIYRSTDGGITWELMNAAAPGSYCRYTHVLTIHPFDPDTVFFGGVELHRSSDGGETFGLIGCPCYHPDIQAIVIPEELLGLAVYMATDGGFYVSDDGGATFRSYNDGLQIGGFQSIASSPLTSTVIGGMQDNSFPEWIGTRVWSGMGSGDGGFTIQDLNKPGFYLGTVQYGLPKYVKSCPLPGGACDASDGIECAEPRAFYPPFVQDPREGHRLFFGSNRLYTSDDGGDWWDAVSPVLVDPGEFFLDIQNENVITAIAPSSDPSSDLTRIYIGYYGGEIFWADFDPDGDPPVWRSVGGPDHGLPDSTVSRIAVDPTDPDVAYVTFSDFDGAPSLYKTTNHGNLWNPVGIDSLPAVPFNTISIEPSAPDHLWLGTDAGVYRSTDAGLSWERSDAGLPHVAVYEFSIDERLDDGEPGNGRIYAATHGRGAFVLARQFVKSNRSCWNGQIASLWAEGHAFPPEENCVLEIVQEDGSVCASSHLDATGFPVGTDEGGRIVARLGGGMDLPVACACSWGSCLDGVPVADCNPADNPIHSVRAICAGAFSAEATVSDPSCGAAAGEGKSALLSGSSSKSPPIPSTLLRLRDRRDLEGGEGIAGEPTTAAVRGAGVERAPRVEREFEIVAAAHSESGPARSFCTVQVSFQADDTTADLLARARDALEADATCMASGVDAEIIGAPPEGTAEGEDEWGSHRALTFGSSSPIDGQPLVSVHAGPGVAPELGFDVASVGLPEMGVGTPVRVRFETLAGGASGGMINITERSLAGTCRVSVPTDPGWTPQQIAAAIATALGTPGAGGGDPDCPEHRRPLDIAHDDDAVLATVANGLLVHVEDAGVGLFLGPVELSGVHPAADAGADTVEQCSGPDGATVVLDGTGSTDPDSTPGTSDDIVLFEWFEDYGLPSEMFLGSGAIVSVVLPVGDHDLTLRVTDTLGLTSVDGLLVSVVDTAGPDTDEDGRSDTCDCAPLEPGAWEVPAEVTRLTASQSTLGPDFVHLTWDSLAAQAGPDVEYDVITGQISHLLADRGFARAECLAGDEPAPGIDRVQPQPEPPLPNGYYYLVRAQNTCGSGGWGSGSGSPDPRDFLDGVACPPECAHGKCETGPPLDADCAPCVTQICQVDPYCCDTHWDSFCVTEVRTVCGSLICPESQGSCAHTLCTTGEALQPGCDSPPAATSCVSAICNVDPFCCQVSWDAACIGEVFSVCASNCD
jgi:photosystem II stability/assembly factor-like uncharacterized protein